MVKKKFEELFTFLIFIVVTGQTATDPARVALY